MGRWGEEEKKTKGIFGCLFAFGVLALSAYTFSLNYPQLQARAAMEKRLGSMITRNWKETETELAVRIRDITIEEGGTIELADIEITKTKEGDGHFSFKVWVRYPIEVNALITKFEVEYPIYFQQAIIY